MRKSVSGKLLVIGALLAAFALVWYSGIGCPILYVTHIPCPGCGITRAVLACLRLDFAAAWRWHPMVFTLPLILAYFLKDGQLFRNKVINYSVLGLLLAGFLVNYVVRLCGGTGLGG